MARVQRVTLEIFYDETEVSAPSDWDWPNVTDESIETIRVVGATKPQPA